METTVEKAEMVFPDDSRVDGVLTTYHSLLLGQYSLALLEHRWTTAVAYLVYMLESNHEEFMIAVRLTQKGEAQCIRRAINRGIAHAYHDVTACDYDRLFAPMFGGLWVTSLINVKQALNNIPAEETLPEVDMPRELELQWEEWELRGH